MTTGKDMKKQGLIAGFDRFMGKIRHFFAETAAEMGRCTWPGRSELIESTILVVVAILLLGIFVAGIDAVARYFIKFITTGTF